MATLASRVAERLRGMAPMPGDSLFTLSRALPALAALVEAADWKRACYCHQPKCNCGGVASEDRYDRAIRALAEALGVAPEQEHRSPKGEERPGERQETEP